MNSVVWGASVALSWMWGLGLFFSVHFTFLYGWTGLLSFAIPNALSLVVFGWIAGRSSRNASLKTWIESAFARHAGLFSLYQIAAVALTLFALISYFLVPLASTPAVFMALSILAIGVFTGELAGIGRLVKLHAVYLAAAVAAAVVLVANGPAIAPATQAGDLPFFAGLLFPMIVGLLLGPAYDIQQWQRAVEMQKRKVPVARSFAFGGVIFFCLLMLNGALALQVTGGLEAGAFIGRDGFVHAQSAITQALSQGGGLPLFLYCVWVLLCLLATFDSAQSALSWFLPTVINANDNPLLRMMPQALLKSTLPAFVLASGAAVLVWSVGGHLEYFMIVYATLFVPYSAILLRDLWDGSKRTEITTTTLFAGLASLLVMSSGYLNDIPLLMTVAGLIALSPLFIERRRALSENGEEIVSAPKLDAMEMMEGSHKEQVILQPRDILPAFDPDGRFDGKWFEIRLTATYSDTNSVGNVYFANYVSWVGKARELFFRRCMPNFDLKQTPFYILTRSFNHKFIREAREFEEIIVRLRIKTYNRKFVKLEHQLFNSARELLGEGEQSLMFVTTDNYSLTDIPSDVVVAFTPHV